MKTSFTKVDDINYNFLELGPEFNYSSLK